MEDESIRHLQERVSELEKRIDFLFDHWNIPHDTNINENPELCAAIQKGNKIEAIRIYRLLTNCDLSMAKQAVEGMWPYYNS